MFGACVVICDQEDEDEDEKMGSGAARPPHAWHPVYHPERHAETTRAFYHILYARHAACLGAGRRNE